jgi:hypothetical protein
MKFGELVCPTGVSENNFVPGIATEIDNQLHMTHTIKMLKLPLCLIN